MRKYELFTLVSLIIIIAIPIMLLLFYTPPEPIEEKNDPPSEEPKKENKDSKSDSNEKEKVKNDKEADKQDKSKEILWGVDSASYTDKEFLGCVVDNYGKPVIWGRYLGEKEGISAGLDSEEVKLLHDNDIKILVIYNHVEDARGHDQGIEHAKQAISLANELDIPKGVAIFVDIEPDYPVDAAFIEGWHNTLAESDYEPGVYGVFSKENKLLNVYHSTEKETIENTIVWTASPQEDITTKKDAPEFNPQGPDNANVYGWQYAIDGEICNIDTNLFKGNMLDFVW